jgi:hypothetical protein
VPQDLCVERVSRDLRADDIVASGLPLADALELLERRPWYFMLEGNTICGILTIADLQVLPVSLVVFGFVLAAEAGIDELIEKHQGEGWSDLLTEDTTGEDRSGPQGTHVAERGDNKESLLELGRPTDDRVQEPGHTISARARVPQRVGTGRQVHEAPAGHAGARRLAPRRDR